MSSKKRFLGVIPARGGSKGLPRKNITSLCGRPLIHWTIEQAKAAKLLDRVIISTDCPEIAEIARDAGADVPFLRPPELAQDNSSVVDAVVHALGALDESFDGFCLLEPTSPLRKNGDIDAGIQLLVDEWENTDAVISAGEPHLENPYLCKSISPTGYLESIMPQSLTAQRQELPRAYFPYGVFYGLNVQTFLKCRTFYPSRIRPYLVERWQNYEINDVIDLITIEAIMKNYLHL